MLMPSICLPGFFVTTSLLFLSGMLGDLFCPLQALLNFLNFVLRASIMR